LIAMARFYDQATLRRAALVGVLWGLALSAKFTAVAILPAMGYGVFQAVQRVQPDRRAPAGVGLWLAGGAAWAAVLAGVIGAGLLAGGDGASGTRAWLYALELAGWLAFLIGSLRSRRMPSSPLLLGAFVTGLALLTFLVIPPEHLTNPGILHSLWDRFSHEMGFHPGFMAEATGLHLLSIVFKSSPVIGISLLTGWLAALWQWRRAEMQVALFISLCYFGCLCILPIAQTFYAVPLLPLLSLFLADGVVRAFTRWRGWVMAGGVIAVAGLALDLVLCYPDFNLNGYQWLGLHILAGRSSVGYRSVVQTPSDGVEQAFTWLNAHSGAGERVRVYVLEKHIMRAVAPAPLYTISSGFDPDPGRAPDYVVTEINTMVPQSWWTWDFGRVAYQPPYDTAWLEQNYSRVYSVRRAFGIEMAAVWKKR